MLITSLCSLFNQTFNYDLDTNIPPALLPWQVVLDEGWVDVLKSEIYFSYFH